ncbi:MAG TPA: 16S rRNA (adenine(1518)-N(6)/adenine(1519)-N(6))-dimethyltransferase RsmA [Thermoanaerobaculia bacterium]|nr:16S rRNA (adenine(1518)-N(6)/adenine(1519)-N(6))-dimethyltransferase RsmA [Thermoanaerobaculia bacterium]
MASPFPPLRRWGQNFLVDPSAAARIVAAAAVSPGESIVEIGPGDGALTRLLARTGGNLLAIEIDPLRAGALTRELAPLGNVAVETGDALDLPIGDRLAAHRLAPPAVVVGNLPYNVATPILRAAVRERGAVSRIVATVQKEVARRLVARPGSDDYGYLSLETAFFADGEVLFDLPPGAFRPRPKVTSAVVRLRPKAPPVPGVALDRLLALASRAFQSRRKTLPNALAAGGSRREWERALASIGRLPTARAEELSPEEFVALAAAGPGPEGENERP